MLSTVEHSSVVHSQDYPLVQKGKKLMTRALESDNCQAGAPLIKLENSVACTVAASGEGYIAVHASHKDRKQLSLYGDPNKTTHMTEVIYTEHSNWIQRAILMLAQWLSIGPSSFWNPCLLYIHSAHVLCNFISQGVDPQSVWCEIRNV